VSALDALRVPGSVSFGGTDLGLIRDVQLLRTASQTPIEAEEFGIEIVDELFVGAVYRVGLALRGFLLYSQGFQLSRLHVCNGDTARG